MDDLKKHGTGMRFGLHIPQGLRLDLADITPADHWRTMLDVVRTAESGPFESIWVFDHLHTMPIPTGEALYEAWALMAALGAVTERVRLGQMCTCMGFRDPAYLAKVAATVDIVSGGRVEMGIGAGWYEHEWRAYGYRFPTRGERIAMLEEGVQIMRQAWPKGVATFVGKHYQVDGAICRPLPLQEGGIPLWIAGGGERKTLRVAAKYAQYTNFDNSPEGFAHKSRVLAEHCRELGTNFDAIVRTANYNVAIGETEKDVQDKLAWIRSYFEPLLPIDMLKLTYRRYADGLLTGTPEQLAEKLASLWKLGMTYAITYFPEAAYDCSGIELFASQVVPALA